jgi:hypothetical protein
MVRDLQDVWLRNARVCCVDARLGGRELDLHAAVGESHQLEICVYVRCLAAAAGWDLGQDRAGASDLADVEPRLRDPAVHVVGEPWILRATIAVRVESFERLEPGSLGLGEAAL